MGKRSNFKKIEKDAYMTTDSRAIRPFFEHYQESMFTYYEPCVGNGDLIKLLNPLKCVGFSDTEKDARNYQYNTDADMFITNPPWTRDILHPIIENLRLQKPTWLLFDADWMFTAQSNRYMKFCKVILPVGRLKWIPGTRDVGKDNCAWYLFIKEETSCTFVPKLERVTIDKARPTPDAGGAGLDFWYLKLVTDRDTIPLTIQPL